MNHNAQRNAPENGINSGIDSFPNDLTSATPTTTAKSKPKGKGKGKAKAMDEGSLFTWRPIDNGQTLESGAPSIHGEEHLMKVEGTMMDILPESSSQGESSKRKPGRPRKAPQATVSIAEILGAYPENQS